MTEHKFVVGIFRLPNDGHFEMFAVFRLSNVECSLESYEIERIQGVILSWIHCAIHECVLLKKFISVSS